MLWGNLCCSMAYNKTSAVLFCSESLIMIDGRTTLNKRKRNLVGTWGTVYTSCNILCAAESHKVYVKSCTLRAAVTRAFSGTVVTAPETLSFPGSNLKEQLDPQWTDKSPTGWVSAQCSPRLPRDDIVTGAHKKLDLWSYVQILL